MRIGRVSIGAATASGAPPGAASSSVITAELAHGVFRGRGVEDRHRSEHPGALAERVARFGKGRGFLEPPPRREDTGRRLRAPTSTAGCKDAWAIAMPAAAGMRRSKPK